MVTKRKTNATHKNGQKQSKKYSMLCKLDSTKMNYIKENPHTAHFFCHYQNVFICDNNQSCKNMSGITYNREFTPEPYYGRDPYLSNILNHKDLKHTLHKLTGIKGINTDWINLYELITQILKQTLLKMDSIRVNGNKLISPLKHCLKRDIDISDTRFNLLLTNEIPEQSLPEDAIVILELSLPLSTNVLNSLDKICINRSVTIFDPSIITQNTPLYLTISPVNGSKSFSKDEFIDTYKKIMERRNDYINKLIFYMKNIEQIPWKHVEETIDVMSSKCREWLKNNPV